MTWHPPPRAEWVEAVNAGRVLPISEEASLPLDRDALLGEARARLGRAGRVAEGFGDDDFLEPLDVLLPALETEADLTVLGRWMARRFLLRLLEVRLQLADYVARDPGVRDEEIRAPLLVTGAPRTGTTLLYQLLALDEGHRVPEGWELLRPVPPPDPVSFATDPRIPLADLELRLPQVVSSGLEAIHEYSGRMPKECLSAMSFAFRSEEFVSRYRVPTYVAWLQRCDMRPAYEAHRLVLQVLQRRFADVRWVLKSPVHLQSLPTVLDVYPDARIVITHRDPLSVLGSVTSLIATLRAAQSDDVVPADIGRYHTDLYAASLDRLVTLDERGMLPSERVRHVAYAELVADPVGELRKLYAHFGLPDAAEAERRAEQRLTGARPGDRLRHEYSFDDLGVDRSTVRDAFARYRAHFRVPDEDRG